MNFSAIVISTDTTNGNISNNAIKAPSYETIAYYYYFMKFVFPTVMLIGMVDNTAILVVLLRNKRVQLNERTRYYYILIAISDFGYILFRHLNSFFGDSLY